MNPGTSATEYEEGYKRGRLDRLLGLRLRVAEHATLPGYAAGYRDGVLGLEQKPRREVFNGR